MNKNECRLKQENFQRDIKIFDNNRGLKMIDMRISQEIDSGENDIEKICNKLRLKKEQLINAVTKSIFNIKNNRIAKT